MIINQYNFSRHITKTLGVLVVVVFNDFFDEQDYIDSISGLLVSLVLSDSLGFSYQRITVVSSSLLLSP
jgi:hypothetical protein